ncbi:hypothetical protein B481_0262 [Planococcus halocryophilus Or1]|uniref:DUF5996 family protein n=1 Tax=Planococcus halocryophilus TaxID=1215089 RepID=UPI0002B88B33|nr:DUF5996 family protein [Planococcus halocryophilus]EMF48141.1 hypothetical protein B481_0262 [Planococcus halocryophilus Or1]
MKASIIKHSEWADTKFTLHLISQILGKVKLATAHKEPQWEHITLSLTPNGFTTGLLFAEDDLLQLDVDVRNSLISINVNGTTEDIPIETSKSIKDYFDEIFHSLHSRGVEVTINPKPQEMAYKKLLNEDETPLTFNQQDAVRGLTLFQFVLNEELKFLAPLRCRKIKPALFWGTFDVSALIVNGIMEEFPEDKVIEKAAFDEHMIEYGCWLGDEKTDTPSFFVLPYPFINKDLNYPSVKPAEAYYEASLSEYFLDLESVMKSDNPSETVQAFFHTTFDILQKELEWEGSTHYFIPLKMD